MKTAKDVKKISMNLNHAADQEPFRFPVFACLKVLDEDSVLRKSLSLHMWVNAKNITFRNYSINKYGKPGTLGKCR